MEPEDQVREPKVERPMKSVAEQLVERRGLVGNRMYNVSEDDQVGTIVTDICIADGFLVINGEDWDASLTLNGIGYSDTDGFFTISVAAFQLAFRFEKVTAVRKDGDIVAVVEVE